MSDDMSAVPRRPRVDRQDPPAEQWGGAHSPVPAGAIITTMEPCAECGYLCKPGRTCPKC